MRKANNGKGVVSSNSGRLVQSSPSKRVCHSIQDLQLLVSSKPGVAKDFFPMPLFCYPADREPHPKVRSRVGFSHLS